MKREIMENEEVFTNEEEKSVSVEERKNNIMSFNDMRNHSNVECDIITNIKDKKQLFNLQNKADFILNDCEGELIRVKNVLIKIYRKPLKTPEIDEETGEILKDREITMSCILVDDAGKSYATGSKMFTIQLMRYIQDFGGEEEMNKNGLEIKIIKKKMTDSNNKALSFEVV